MASAARDVFSGVFSKCSDAHEHQFRALQLRRREILALEKFTREGNDFALCRLIDGFDTHDVRRKQRRVIADEPGKFILGGAMTDNHDFMRGFQGATTAARYDLASWACPEPTDPAL